MSLCTPEEIAEKRRIALERLNVRKHNSSTRANIQHITSSSIQQGRSFQERNTSQARIAAQPYPKHSPFKSKPNTDEKSNTAPNVAHPMSSYGNIPSAKCTCALTSENRFGISTSSYIEKAIEVCKSIPSRIYDPAKRLWSFNIKDYNLVVERFQPLRPNIELEEIPKKILALCAAPNEIDDGMISSCMASISDSLRESLLPFQSEGVAFGIGKQGRVLIADEMGLGKTYQALALADFYKEDWPLFIATTATTRDTWVSHVRKLLPYVNCHHIACITASHEFFEDAKVVVSSYAMMEKCAEKLEAMHFGVLIMDESHNLKNTKAKCTLIASKLAKKAKRVILLSGTPALSRPVELYSQLKMLDKGFLGFMDFTKRYCDGQSGAYGWDANGQSNLDELKVILSKKFMIRRIKSDVLPQLAEKYREVVYLDPALIKPSAVLNHFAKSYSNNFGRVKEDVLIMYYSETGHTKCAAVCAYLNSILKEEIKFVVFAHHKVVLDSICACLKEKKVSHIRIDGSTKNDSRAQRVNRFQTKNSCRVAVLSLKACNAGISLTAAQLIIFAELDWNPSTLAQAESRAHRIGQENEVTCRYLLAQNTADDVIWPMLHNKQDVLNKVGLFSEDLRNNEHVVCPNSAGNIDKYVVKTPRKTNKNADNSTDYNADDSIIQQIIANNGSQTEATGTTKHNSSADSGKFDDLLNDGEDADFVNIDF